MPFKEFSEFLVLGFSECLVDAVTLLKILLEGLSKILPISQNPIVVLS
jgi:hypothetical protein